jgi:hypothetical protein
MLEEERHAVRQALGAHFAHQGLSIDARPGRFRHRRTGTADAAKMVAELSGREYCGH